MLHRAFDPAVIYASFMHDDYASFADWKQAADNGTDALKTWIKQHAVRQKGDSLPVESKIYGALKDSLKQYFHGKCAYCESEFVAVSWGDVEHYRPKRAVTDEVHEGYYWLAYAERNLMPSCQLCNQGKGKRNQFPIDGVRARKPGDDLLKEDPLLLNPYEPGDCGSAAVHFSYDIRQVGNMLLPSGRIDGLTRRGQKSIEVYDLNRAALVSRRRDRQRAAIDALEATWRTPAFEERWEEQFTVEREYATAVRAVCVMWQQMQIARLTALRFA